MCMSTPTAIYGSVRIGNNCVVGANAIVTKSFPEERRVITGVLAKAIHNDVAGEHVLRRADAQASSCIQCGRAARMPIPRLWFTNGAERSISCFARPANCSSNAGLCKLWLDQ